VRLECIFKNMPHVHELEEQAEMKSQKLKKFPHVKCNNVHVTFRSGRNNQKICDIVILGHDHTFKARATAEVLDLALDKAFQRICRQVEKLNSKFKSHNRSHDGDMLRSA
jgi:ribosomal subunit interface protein